MDIEVEDIALEAQTILHGRFQIREVHYIGEQGITYIGYDKIRKRMLSSKNLCPIGLQTGIWIIDRFCAEAAVAKTNLKNLGKPFRKNVSIPVWFRTLKNHTADAQPFM